MHHHRTSHAILTCTLLALTSSLAANATPKAPNPCKQMKRDLDRQVDDLKSQQKDDLKQCAQANGADSYTCLSLKDQQQQDLEDRRNDRSQRLAGCNRYGYAVTPFPVFDFPITEDDYYPMSDNCVAHHYRNCYPHKDHYDHHVKDPDKHHHYRHHEPSPSGSGVKTADTAPGKPAQQAEKAPSDRSPRHVDTAMNGGGRDHASHDSARGDSSSSAHSSHSGGAGGGGSSSSFSGSAHSSGGGSSSGSSSGASHSGSSSSGAASSAASAPAASSSHPK